MSDDDKPNDEDLFSLENVKIQEWCSKDRKVATLRMSDKDGMCDLKIYFVLKSKVEEYELLMNMQDGNDEKH